MRLLLLHCSGDDYVDVSDDFGDTCMTYAADTSFWCCWLWLCQGADCGFSIVCVRRGSVRCFHNNIETIAGK